MGSGGGKSWKGGVELQGSTDGSRWTSVAIGRKGYDTVTVATPDTFTSFASGYYVPIWGPFALLVAAIIYVTANVYDPAFPPPDAKFRKTMKCVILFAFCWFVVGLTVSLYQIAVPVNPTRGEFFRLTLPNGSPTSSWLQGGGGGFGIHTDKASGDTCRAPVRAGSISEEAAFYSWFTSAKADNGYDSFFRDGDEREGRRGSVVQPYVALVGGAYNSLLKRWEYPPDYLNGFVTGVPFGGVPSSQAECLAVAVKQYGTKITGTHKSLTSGSWADVPSGCTIQTGGDWSARWNTRSDGTNYLGMYTQIYSSWQTGVACPPSATVACPKWATGQGPDSNHTESVERPLVCMQLQGAGTVFYHSCSAFQFATGQGEAICKGAGQGNSAALAASSLFVNIAKGMQYQAARALVYTTGGGYTSWGESADSAQFKKTLAAHEAAREKEVTYVQNEYRQSQRGAGVNPILVVLPVLLLLCGLVLVYDWRRGGGGLPPPSDFIDFFFGRDRAQAHVAPAAHPVAEVALQEVPPALPPPPGNVAAAVVLPAAQIGVGPVAPVAMVRVVQVGGDHRNEAVFEAEGGCGGGGGGGGDEMCTPQGLEEQKRAEAELFGKIVIDGISMTSTTALLRETFTDARLGVNNGTIRLPKAAIVAIGAAKMKSFKTAGEEWPAREFGTLIKACMAADALSSGRHDYVCESKSGPGGGAAATATTAGVCYACLKKYRSSYSSTVGGRSRTFCSVACRDRPLRINGGGSG